MEAFSFGQPQLFCLIIQCCCTSSPETSAAWAGSSSDHWEAGDLQPMEPIIAAAKTGNVDWLLKLIEKGADLNFREYVEVEIGGQLIDRYSNTVLRVAVEHGHLAFVDALLRRGVDVNAQSGLLRSRPLHYTIAAESFRFVPSLTSKLIAAGANVDEPSCDGPYSLTPYGAALKYGRRPSLAMLLRAGATPITDHVTRDSEFANFRNEAAWALHDAVESAGGWVNYYCAVCAARRAAGICICIRKRIPMDLFHDIAAFVPAGEWGQL